ncbi:MAG: T9SS type A sorting domain-containing protein [Dysgonamonadaceae bacterium]|jgi:pectate lyase|nr:T9SS type A sorting domain-containing protein [Dysgonamonadaceae bacterium]
MKQYKLIFIGLVTCISLLSGAIQAQTKAFPTAEGFGSMATGGRGGKVVEVTTVADNATTPPEGSLRWALQQYPGEPITIVFRVSGIINLEGGKAGELRCKRNNWTLAGQTAPGDGVCIMGNKVNFGGSTNLVIRHLRFRIGTMVDPVTGEPDASGKGSIGIENASNWIIDHCTFGWSGEENMTIYDNVNTTIQWSIVHEGLYQSGHNKGNRGYGAQWGGQNATFHHNLLAHNHNRSPRFNGARSNDINVLIDYVNNVNYNWGKANSCYGSDIENTSNRTNFVNNYYKPGPARPGTSASYFTQSSFSSSQSTGRIALWYMNGNRMEGSANTAKNTDNYLGLDASAYVAKGVSADLLKSETPFPIAYPVTTETAEQAYESVLAGAGAFPRDAVDTRIVNEVRTGTASGSGVFGANKGIIDSPDAVGGYPIYNSLEAPVDSDHDGMPDAWETAHGLNPNDPDDRNIRMETGYTALEVYLNELAGETIEFKLATAIPGIQVREWSVYHTRNELHVTAGVDMARVRIFNVLGQTLIDRLAGTNASIDTSELSSGVYLAEVITVNDGKKTLKFSK